LIHTNHYILGHPTAIPKDPKNRGNYFSVEASSAGRYRIAIYIEIRAWYSFGVYDVDQRELSRGFIHGREKNVEFEIRTPGKYFIVLFNYPGGGPPHSFDFIVQRLS
jgi:hypothetical protein